jgi:hypothetical protein
VRHCRANGFNCVYVDIETGITLDHLLTADLWPPRENLYSPKKHRPCASMGQCQLQMFNETKK